MTSEGTRGGSQGALAPRAWQSVDQLDWPRSGALATGIAGCVLFAASPHGNDYWGAIPSIAAFALAPMFFPQVRARVETPICPLNAALLLFLFQLVIDPLLICWSGPYRYTLPLLPDSGAINVAQLVSVVAWMGFVLGLEIDARWRPSPPQLLRSIGSIRLPRVAPSRLALAFAVIGLGGMALAYHSPGALVDYFRNPAGHVGLQNTVGQSGPIKSVSLWLRPFLAASLLIPWSLWVDHRVGRRRLAWLTLAIGIPVALASATYSYNRSSIVVPLVALFAVYGTRVRRIRFAVVILIALLALVLLTTARAYRNSNVSISKTVTSSAAREQVLNKVSLSHEIQIYTSAPQFLGFLLSRTNFGHDPKYGRTLVSSLMYPVPLLGKPFRAHSGTLIYNRLIYGNTEYPDQVVPFQGELFLDFTVPGVLVGYLCLGFAVAAIQRAFQRARTAMRAFAWQYAALWLSFLVIGSLSVVSQVAIYFFWPFLIFEALRDDGRQTA
jgi:hypothetical protein